MPSLEQLYGEPDNLRGLIHPACNRGFRYFNDSEMIPFAVTAASTIRTSGIDRVVVAETGAAPYAHLCDRLLGTASDSISWLYMKFPREPLTTIFHVLDYYLGDEERNQQIRMTSQTEYDELEQNSGSWTRSQLLRAICARMPAQFFREGKADIDALLDTLALPAQMPFQRAVSCALDGTRISNFLKKPFIYFDEYIDSGTTFRNAIQFFRCFTPAPQLKTVTYFINVDEPSHDCILHTSFPPPGRPDCYDSGAYPYENRVDLIGHFYRLSESAYVKTSVSSFVQDEARDEEVRHARQAAIEQLLEDLQSTIDAAALTQVVKSRILTDQLKPKINNDDTNRYCLWWLEKTAGTPDGAEFLFQLFDMYGPAWSPMPTDFHFEFWNVFQGVGEYFQNLEGFQRLVVSYRKVRFDLLHEIAKTCVLRREAWLANIEDLIGNSARKNPRQTRQTGETQDDFESDGQPRKRTRASTHIG